MTTTLNSGLTADQNQTLVKINAAFEEFKVEHTKQLEQVQKGNADALQALKVDAINASALPFLTCSNCFVCSTLNSSKAALILTNV